MYTVNTILQHKHTGNVMQIVTIDSDNAVLKYLENCDNEDVTWQVKYLSQDYDIVQVANRSEIQFRSSSVKDIEIVKMVVWNNIIGTIESKEFELSVDYCFKVIEFVEIMGYETKIWTNTNFETYFILHSEFSDIKSFEALVQIFQSLS